MLLPFKVPGDLTTVPLRAVALFAALISSASQAQVDWSATSGLSDSDKTALVALVRQFGLDGLERASEFLTHPTNRKIYVITGPISFDGLRRVWREVEVCRSNEDHCQRRSKLTVGDWAIASEIVRQERWHFSEGDMTVEVELGSGISYAEARTIVLAIHQKRLTLAPELAEFADAFDANKIAAIRVQDPIAREFEVSIDNDGSGYVLSVRLTDDEVLLHDLAFWIA